MRQPQIVLLDSNLLNDKWRIKLEECLKTLGNLKSYFATDSSEVINRCTNAQIIILDKCIIKDQHLSKLTNSQYLIEIATGYDNIDIINAKKYGIKVSNIPNYSTLSVAQHTIALLCELSNQVGGVSQLVKYKNKWRDINHSNLELAGLTLGLIGYGNIAQKVAKIALALDMKVIVASRTSTYSTDLNVEFVDKETLFKSSDFISLHCSLNTDTKNTINSNTLSLMKKTAYLINTGRGGLINEIDLYNALLACQIRGAALDVLNTEPIKPDNPLLKLDNCIITPHNAFISDASLNRWLNIIIDSVRGYLTGNYINLVC